MKSGYTDITLLIDRSGSMNCIRDDVIGGVNAFIADQKQCKGTATLTLVQFDDQYEVNYIAKDIQEVELLNYDTYRPRGMTAMLDAIAKTIITTGERYSAMAEDDRPERIIFIIQTDGEENQSIEYSRHSGGYDRIKALTTEQSTKYSWEFVFMGSNIDAKATASTIGVKSANAMKCASSGMGTTTAFQSLSSNLRACRMGDKVDMSYTQDDYRVQSSLGTEQS